MLLMQTSWDVVSTWIKYTEKFFVIPGTDKIITKPFDAWTKEHQDVAQAMDYVECVNLSMQTGVFFLLQCFWNYLSNSVAKKSFMSSMEFKFYIFWALGSVAVFPILQWYFREDEYLRETAPQMAYSIEVLFTVVLGIRSNRRFSRILKIASNMKHGRQIVDKLAYFKDMNVFLTVILFFYGVSLLTLCVDGLTTAKVINSNKFASDLLIANCNMCSVLMWIVGISIFHPRRSYQEIEASIHTNSLNTTSGNTNQRVAPDIEMSNTGEKFHNENKNGGGAPRFNNNSNNTSGSNNTAVDSGFMRPMSPVEVDYQPRSFTPTHQFSEKSSLARNVSVDDPYSKSSVNFAMMDPASLAAAAGKRYNSDAGRMSYERSTTPISVTSRQQLGQEYQLQSMNSKQQDDFRFSRDSFDYTGTQKSNYQTPGGRI